MKRKSRVKKWLYAFGILSIFLVPLLINAQAGASDKIKKFDSATDMEVVGDESNLSLYNVFVSGNHSANAADTEGALAIQGTPFIPKGGKFNYAGFFDNPTGAGEGLTERHKIAMLTGNPIQFGGDNKTGHATIGGGILLMDENDKEWVNDEKINVNGSIRTVNAEQKKAIFNQLNNELVQLTKGLEDLTAETKPWKDGKATVTGNGPDLREWPVEQSVKDSKVLVVNAEPLPGSETAFLPQPNWKKDPEVDQIIIVSHAKKIVVYSDSQDINVGKGKPGNWTNRVFYTPNATQVTNFYQGGSNEGPDVDHDVNGNKIDQDNLLKNNGNDPYDGAYLSQYVRDHHSLLSGSLVAPNATTIWDGASINGYVFVKNFHQRGNSEAHNWYNPWLFEDLGSLQISKIDKVNRELLAGAEFEVRSEDQTLKHTIVTDEEGIAQLSNLAFGTYEVQETKAPEGYELDPTIHKVILSEETPQLFYQLVLGNQKKEEVKGSLQITKLDKESQLPLKDAEFQVTAKNQKWQKTITSNVSGVALLRGLPFGDYQVKETVAPEGYELDSTIYDVKIEDSDSQHLYQMGVPNKKIVEKLGELQITKLNEDTREALAGAVFEVKKSDGTFETTVTTNEEGIAHLSELTFGKYHVQEIMAPEGHELDDTIYEVTVSDDSETAIEQLVITNKSVEEPDVEETKGSLQITKFDEATREMLAGAVFEVRNKDSGDSQKMTTNVAGLAWFKGLDFGHYDVEEIVAPDGYQRDETVYEVTIDENTPQYLYQLPVSNRKMVSKGSLQITKADAETMEMLAGAEFTVTRAEDGSLVDTITSNVAGIAWLNGLEFGTYQVQETKAPDGYELDETVHTVELSDETPQHLYQMVLYNQEKRETKGRMRLSKIDKDTHKMLKNAVFRVQNADKTYEETVTTNVAGIGELKGIPFGEYTVQEIEAPEGYELDETIHHFSLSEDTPLGVISLVYSNKKQVEIQELGEIQIKKIDEETASALKGAEFTLYDANKEKLNTTLSNDKGLAVFENLTFGTYYVQETKAPEGYELDEKMYEVQVSSDNQGLVMMDVTNQKVVPLKLGEIQLLKVDQDNKAPLKNAEFTLYDQDKKVIKKGKTDKEGRLSFVKLAFGDYYIRETKAPEGYELDETWHKVTISEKENGKINLTLENKKSLSIGKEEGTKSTSDKGKGPIGKGDLPQTGEKNSTPILTVIGLLIVGSVLGKLILTYKKQLHR